jgi:hypothetical protein
LIVFPEHAPVQNSIHSDARDLSVWVLYIEDVPFSDPEIKLVVFGRCAEVRFPRGVRRSRHSGEGKNNGKKSDGPPVIDQFHWGSSFLEALEPGTSLAPAGLVLLSATATISTRVP